MVPIGSALRTVSSEAWRDAIPDSVVDHFEETIYERQENSLSDLYFDETGAFTRDQNAPVFEESYSLKGGGNPGEMYSTSGLPRYPVQDETVRYNHQFGPNNADVGYIFGLRASGGTPDGYYLAETRFNDNELRLFRSDGDMQYTEISSRQSVSLSSGTEYIGEVEWLSDGSITFRLLDSSESELASISATDTTFDSSGGDGIGWRVRGGQGTFDHLRVVWSSVSE